MYNYGYSFVHEEEIRTYPHPVKRFLARMTDFALSAVVTYAIYVFILSRAPIYAGIKDGTIFMVAAGVVSALIEALMLSLFGTTAGKALFGIWITGGYRRKLAFRDALTRSFKRFLIGEGLMLLIISLVRMSKSYQTCRDGNIMDYDDYTVYDIKNSNYAVSIIGMALCGIIAVCLVGYMTLAGMAPPNSGEINTEQFIENYNYFVDYTYSAGRTRKLDDTMRFVSEDGAKAYENTSNNFYRIGKGEILDGMELKIAGWNYNHRHFYDFSREMDFVIMSLADSSLADRFNMLKNGTGVGFEQNISMEFADMKVEYTIMKENFAYSAPDWMERGMFGPVNEDEKSTLEMHLRVKKIK